MEHPANISHLPRSAPLPTPAPALPGQRQDGRTKAAPEEGRLRSPGWSKQQEEGGSGGKTRSKSIPSWWGKDRIELPPQIPALSIRTALARSRLPLCAPRACLSVASLCLSPSCSPSVLTPYFHPPHPPSSSSSTAHSTIALIPLLPLPPALPGRRPWGHGSGPRRWLLVSASQKTAQASTRYPPILPRISASSGP